MVLIHEKGILKQETVLEMNDSCTVLITEEDNVDIILFATCMIQNLKIGDRYTVRIVFCTVAHRVYLKAE